MSAFFTPVNAERRLNSQQSVDLLLVTNLLLIRYKDPLLPVSAQEPNSLVNTIIVTPHANPMKSKIDI